MQMAAGPGPEFPDTRAGGSGPFDAKALADRAWLAALPDELGAQRRIMAGLAGRCEAWPLATSLLVGCSLGRARPTRFPASTPRSALTPRAAAGAGAVGAMEAMVAAALPELGALADVLRHRSGPAGQWVRRIFAQFADSTQLDPAVVAEAQIQAPPQRRRPGLHPAVPGTRPPGSQNRTPGCRPPAAPPAVSCRPRTRSPVSRSRSGPDLARLSAQVGRVPDVVQALGTDSFGAGFGQRPPGMVPGCSAAAPVPVAWLSRRPQDRGHHPSGEEL
jgi:hypothetical protein